MQSLAPFYGGGDPHACVVPFLSLQYFQVLLDGMLLFAIQEKLLLGFSSFSTSVRWRFLLVPIDDTSLFKMELLLSLSRRWYSPQKYLGCAPLDNAY